MGVEPGSVEPPESPPPEGSPPLGGVVGSTVLSVVVVVGRSLRSVVVVELFPSSLPSPLFRVVVVDP